MDLEEKSESEELKLAYLPHCPAYFYVRLGVGFQVPENACRSLRLTGVERKLGREDPHDPSHVGKGILGICRKWPTTERRERLGD